MASVNLNMDFGVSVSNGPLSVMQVSWAAPKFKATSYYSNKIIHYIATDKQLEPFFFFPKFWFYS